VGGITRAPEKLSAGHDVATFDSGEAFLDEWLRGRALDNGAKGASRTYVVCSGKRVAGFYALAAGAIAHGNASGRVKRNMPDPVPVMLLGQLAVHSAFQGQGIGAGLLREAAHGKFWPFLSLATAKPASYPYTL
jgi:GNAT superfamily N-acetyltransferase